MYWVVSRNWTRFSYSACKRSRPNNKKFSRISFHSLELVAVSKTSIFEQPSSASSNSPQSGRYHGDERRSVGAQDMDTSWYQVSDLNDFEFYWENDQLDVDAPFRPAIYTPFSPKAFDDLEMRGSAENSILLDEEEDKENSPPTTTVSERPTRLPALLRNRSFATRIEIAHDFAFRNLFHCKLPFLCLNQKYK